MRNRPSRAGAVVFTAATFGLLSGWLDGLIRLARTHVVPENARPGVLLLWMPAVANGIYLVVAALPLVLLAAVKPRWVTPSRLVFASLFPAICLGLWPLNPPLAKYAIGLLAAGIAVQAARFADRDPGRFERGLRRTLLAVGAYLLLTATSIGVVRDVGSWLALRRASPVRGRNVVLLVLDTVRAMSLSLYGYDRPTTPNLTRIARRGALFDRAYSTAPWTLPSHASMFTGRWAWELEADWRTPLSHRYSTLAEVLAARGYATAGFVANLAYTQREMGLGRGFGRYDAYRVSLEQVLKSSRAGRELARRLQPLLGWLGPSSPGFDRKTADDINRAVLGWVDRHGDRPFFVFANYFDAHQDYYVPSGYDSLFRRGAGRKAAGARADSIPIAVRSRLRYEQAIRYLDEAVGRLVDSLGRRGVLNNTVLVITADHGEEIMEHGWLGHGGSVYLPALWVPLIVIEPGVVPAGRVVPDAVSPRDLAATILDLLGADPALPGRSLARYWKGPAPGGVDTLFAEVRASINMGQIDSAPGRRGDVHSVIVGDRHLIVRPDGRLELFDIRADPGEQENLLASAGDSALAGTLLSALEASHARPVPAGWVAADRSRGGVARKTGS